MFKSWELLDPSSKRALDRANRQPYQHYLSAYVLALDGLGSLVHGFV